MELGIFGSSRSVSELTEQVQKAADLGYATFWTPQIFNLDALTALAVVSSKVSDIRLGTSVVPTYPRHPMMLAQQALTVNQVSGGRLDLGIGYPTSQLWRGCGACPLMVLSVICETISRS